jgi:Trypsin-like peptidase domain
MACTLCALYSACGTVNSTPLVPVGDDEVRQLFRVQWTGTSGFSGHAFLLDRGKATPLALTAFHVAGPHQTMPLVNPMSSSPTGLLVSPMDSKIAVRLGERVRIIGARTISGSDSQHDLAAFKVLDWDSSRALHLASTPPAVGDTVWVLAVHAGDGRSTQHPLGGPRRHRARVDVSNDSAFVYSYLASANTNFTSGAAVLNRDGHVVGVNVGSVVMSAQSWTAWRARYAGCCAYSTGAEVAGLAVGLRAIQTHLDRLSTTR